MARVKCGGCGERIEKDTAVRFGIQSFCPDGDCRRPKPRKTTTKPAKRTKPSTDLDPALRRKILERDGGCCRWCGVSGSHLHVHHARYRSSLSVHDPLRDSEENLITLCDGFANGCHEKAHASKRTIQPILLFVLQQHHEERIFLTVPQAMAILDQSNVSVTES